MRILVLLRGFDTLNKHVPGNFELDQAKALAAAGHDVRAVAVDTRSPLHPRRVGSYEYTADGIPVLYVSYPSGRGIPALQDALSTAGMKKAFRILDREGWRPDIVHAHFLSKGRVFCTVAECERIPFVITEHTSWLNNRELDEKTVAQMRLVYGKAARVIAVGKGLHDNILFHTGVEAQIVPNIADTSVFTRPGTRRQRGETFHFVTVGNLYRRKGFDLLLSALAELLARGEHVRLTLIGGGEEETALKSQARELGIENAVRFTGALPRERIAQIYADADAFVLASRGETFGVVYIEAMSAGLPVIATRCGGPEDFVDENNGILIEPEDIPALTNAMKRMIHERERFDDERIAAFAKEHFSPQAVAARLTEIFKEIVPC